MAPLATLDPVATPVISMDVESVDVDALVPTVEPDKAMMMLTVPLADDVPTAEPARCA